MKRFAIHKITDHGRTNPMLGELELGLQGGLNYVVINPKNWDVFPNL